MRHVPLNLRVCAAYIYDNALSLPFFYLFLFSMETTEIFKDNLFKGKVLLCSGGGSGICRAMTEAVVRHGAKAVIFSRRYISHSFCHLRNHQRFFFFLAKTS